MEQKSNKDTKKEKQEFKIYVTYEKNGIHFQEIAENILLRKMNE